VKYYPILKVVMDAKLEIAKWVLTYELAS